MKPNDVFSWRDFDGSPYALIVQGAFYDYLETVLVIPLFSNARTPAIEIINPVILVRDRKFQARTELMGAVPRSSIGKFIQSANTHSVEISRAIDRLMTGF